MNKKSNHLYTSLSEWAEQNAIAFKLGSTDSLNEALNQVVKSLSPSIAALGLGEPYHVMNGDERFLNLRNELFKILVEKHGYSAIAVESSFVKSSVINEYILGGAGSFDTAKEAGFSHEFYKQNPTRELIEWMREYNADPSHTTKLHFYGFDAPTEMTGTDSPRQSLYLVLNYLIKNDLADERQKNRISDLIGDDTKWESMEALMHASKSVGKSKEANQLRLECELLITILELHRPSLINKSGMAEYRYIMHIAGIARHLLNYHAAMAEESDQRLSILLGIRDVIMAKNIQYILEVEKGRGKLLAHAHNRHLQYGTVEWQLGSYFNKWWPAGAHLQKMLGDKYAVIGAGLHSSDIEGTGLPEQGSLEYLLSEHTPTFIPTLQGKGLPKEKMAKLKTRNIGKNPTYMPLDTKSFTDFNWLIML